MLGICVDDEEALEFLRSKGGDVGFVDAAEFQRAVGRQWAVEGWAKSLPLAEMLADALPNCTGCHRLRAVSVLKQEEIVAIADGYRDGLIQVLNEHVAMLKNAYDAMAVYTTKSGTKLHFKSPTAERRHVLCVGVGGDRTHAARPQGSRVCPP